MRPPATSPHHHHTLHSPRVLICVNMSFPAVQPVLFKEPARLVLKLVKFPSLRFSEVLKSGHTAHGLNAKTEAVHGFTSFTFYIHLQLQSWSSHLTSYPRLWPVGGSRRTSRELTQTHGEHAEAAQEDPRQARESNFPVVPEKQLWKSKWSTNSERPGEAKIIFTHLLISPS